MNQALILQVAVPTPLRQAFDYIALSNNTKDYQPGMRVKISFGRKTVVGIILGTSSRSQVPKHKLKPIIELLDDAPLLTDTLFKLNHWLADYYHHPIGEVMLQNLPKRLRQGKKTSANLPDQPQLLADQQPTLNASQETATNTILAATGFKTFLLDGVTGSGKTEVYLRVIENILAQGKQALVLVPEIGLTPQTVSRFQSRFAVPIAVLHSKLNDTERASAWLAAKQGDAKIIIGTRSALFTPMLTPGVIILDEEHDLSFKQQSGLRYNARDTAIMRAHIENIPIVLGSATPSLSSLHNAQQKKFVHLKLPERAGYALHPVFHTIDLRSQSLHHGLSQTVVTKIKQHLEHGNQVLIFLNRRGYSPVLLCHACGWSAECKRCDSKLTMHQKTKQLRCHHCDARMALPSHCPDCHRKELMKVGIGTERLQEAVSFLFPNYSCIRIDRDTTQTKKRLDEALQDIQTGKHQLLIGTQMLAKGHHFANLTLVAVVDADTGLYGQDFRATERMGQLLLQVSGRAGRADKPGEVLIQTHHPDHPLLNILIKDGYPAFAAELLQQRKATMLPPFNYLGVIRAEANTPEKPIAFLESIFKQAANVLPTGLELLGPIPALMHRKAGHYRAQLILHASSRNKLQQFVTRHLPKWAKTPAARQVRWHIDIDPEELM